MIAFSDLQTILIALLALGVIFFIIMTIVFLYHWRRYMFKSDRWLLPVMGIYLFGGLACIGLTITSLILLLRIV